MPYERHDATMCSDTSRGVVVLYGGRAAPAYLAETWEWNGERWSFVTRDGPGGRGGASLAFDSRRGVSVLFGGSDSTSYLGETWEWNGTTWTLASTNGPARIDHWSVFDEARGVTLVGGGSISPIGKLADMWSWDGSTWTLVPAPIPALLEAPGAAYDRANGTVVLFGGLTWSGPSKQTWIWDGSTWTSPSTPVAPSPRDGCRMTWVEGVGVVLFGGRASNPPDPDDVWIWDGSAWHKHADHGYPNGLVAQDASGTALVHNEYGNTYSWWVPFAGVATWRWSSQGFTKLTSPTPSARFGATAYFNPAHATIEMIGGATDLALWPDAPSDSIRDLADEWRYWTTPYNTDMRRAGAAAFFDSSIGKPILFGGAKPATQFYTTMDDTWVVDIPFLEKLDLSTHPPKAKDVVGAYHERELAGIVIGSSAFAGSVWEWRNSTWSPQAGTLPDARSTPAVTYDERREVITLFGGNASDDTWEWDGSNWAMVSTDGPAPRYRPAMVFDRSRGVCILFGGIKATGGLLDDTWEWDGEQWREILPIGPRPLPRIDAAFAHDPDRFRTLLFGGTQWGLDYPLGDGWVLRRAFHITSHPADVNASNGDPVEFSVATDPATGLEFQWRRDGVPLVDDARISGSTTTSLRIDPLVLADAGRFDVVVTGPNDSPAYSLRARLDFPCPADCERDADLDLFDFLCFQGRFADAHPFADFDGNGTLDVNDYLAFVDRFAGGCP